MMGGLPEDACISVNGKYNAHDHLMKKIESKRQQIKPVSKYQHCLRLPFKKGS